MHDHEQSPAPGPARVAGNGLRWLVGILLGIALATGTAMWLQSEKSVETPAVPGGG
ncbi:MAG: hypothetical protein KGM17_02340 [Sphingomonadales bacterium]|nr:hypothetical protein [Sphingomonadales bacterium]